jgi:hypothetical protein
MTERISSNIGPPCAEKVGADFHLFIAGRTAHISGISATSALTLQTLLGAMIVPSDGRRPDLAMGWEGFVAVGQPGQRLLRARNEHQIPSLTLILLLERLLVLEPSLLILHGNAVVDTACGRLFLLVGDSGAGKTTLTRELLTVSGRHLLCEDTLLLDLDKKLIHPFPRAASLRIDSDDPAHQGADLWRGLGARRMDKALVPPRQVHANPLPLSGAEVVLLEQQDSALHQSSDAPQEPGETYWLSSCEHSLLSVIRDQIMPEASLRDPANESSSPSLAFPRLLDPSQRERLISLLARHGIMILASHVGNRSAPETKPDRPHHPVLHPLPPFEGIRRLLDFSVAFGAPDLPPVDHSRTLMGLAHVMNEARFHRLTPGGTPASTIDCLMKAIESTR